MTAIDHGILYQYTCMDILGQPLAFDWDRANHDKNWLKHKVRSSECEQIFINNPLIVKEDDSHSKSEQRFQALGKTNSGRKLFVAFTIRKHFVRIISARDMSRRERRIYEEAP